MEPHRRIERNREVVAGFFEAMRAGDPEGLRAALRPDAVWHIPRSGGLSSPRGAEEIIALLTGAPGDFYLLETIRFERGFLVADEHHAALQFRMRCMTAGGLPYDNLYVFGFRLAEGRIAEGWEHTDTAYWQRTLRRGTPDSG